MPRVNRLFSDLVGSARLWNQATPAQVGTMLGLPGAMVTAVERGECAPPMHLPLVEQWASIFALDGDLLLRAAMLAWGKVELPLDLDSVAAPRNTLALRLVRDWAAITDEQCRDIHLILQGAGATREPDEESPTPFVVAPAASSV